jgi:tetratricopeptide (TPR) repeat protein
MSGLERLRGAAQAQTQTYTHSEEWAGMAPHAGKTINDKTRAGIAGFAGATGTPPRGSSTSAASSSSTSFAGGSAPSRNSTALSLCSTYSPRSAASDDGLHGEFAYLLSPGLLVPAETPQANEKVTAWTQQTMDWDDALARTLARTRYVVELVHNNDAAGGQTVPGDVEVAGVAGEGASGVADAADKHCRCLQAKGEEADDEERDGWRCQNIGVSYFMSQRYSEALHEHQRAHAIWVKRGDVARQTEESCLIGGCYLGLGEYGLALRHLKKYKALKNASGQTRACVQLGSCYYQLALTEQALATYQDAEAMSNVLDEGEKAEFLGHIRKGVDLCHARLAEEAAKLQERVNEANRNAERLLQELEEEHAGAATKAACKKRGSQKKRAGAAGQEAAAAPVVVAAPRLAAEPARCHVHSAPAAVAGGARFISEEEGQAEEDAAEPAARGEADSERADAQGKGGRASTASSSSSSSSSGRRTATMAAGSGPQVFAPDVVDVAARVPVAVDQECCVCMATQKCSIFVPCGHLCVCVACAKCIMAGSKECPVCRAVSSLCIKVYS